MKIKLNPDKTLVKEIDDKLKENKIIYGKRYCPCSLVKNDDTVCPCKEFMENETLTECHCGKFIRE